LPTRFFGALSFNFQDLLNAPGRVAPCQPASEKNSGQVKAELKSEPYLFCHGSCSLQI
jgi:hypothetical protein